MKSRALRDELDLAKAGTPPVVVFVGAFPPPVNGLSNANASTVRALEQAGHQVVKYNLSPSPGVGVVRYHLSRLANVFRAMLAIARQREKISVGYMPIDGGYGLVYGILCALVFRVLKTPIAAHHHSFSYVDRPSLLMRAFLRCAPGRQIHVFLCADMRLKFEARYGPRLLCDYKGLVLPNASIVGGSTPERASRPVTTGAIIGHLSNLSFEKGTDLFLDLFEKLIADGVQVSAILAGPVADDLLRSRIDWLTARDPARLRYEGAVYGDAKIAFFKEIDIFIFPTRYRNEAQPLVLIEAANAGCILSTTVRGCISCDFSGSGALLVADPHAFVEEASEWIADLVTSPLHAEALHARAYAHATESQQASVQSKAEWLETLAGFAPAARAQA